MGPAEVISLDEVRASKQWASLRQQLHDYFDLWLDDLQAQLPEPETTLEQMTETVWALRQELTGSLTEAIVDHAHRFEFMRQDIVCETCQRIVTTRPLVSRTVATLWWVECAWSAPIFIAGCANKGVTRSMRRSA